MKRKEKYSDRLLMATSAFRLFAEHPDLPRTDEEVAKIISEAAWAMTELSKIRAAVSAISGLEMSACEALELHAPEGKTR